ncbi:unnamed protein product [Didymodactylos carnosus]|uniref:Uncharacterized protein n=1 Tax=Didymodactylos carnosus TaxID=1234261 RepID=A0A814X762_9BILA|nr:unnamed protein product [Didymodactylos carnosus]CAF1211921.1 unnamed protein product [Didymodactylos carnosus]CAF3528749.1 unnamed protein product [Didymodactylos carnosus]CAF3975886.1 unnamed protein product [Didymodactylos carnosus]
MSKITVGDSKYIIVWLDRYIGVPGEYENLKDQFRQGSRQLETFTDPDKCLNFIRRCNDRAIFLIASGTLGQIIVPKVYDYPQIYSIFILCMNITKHKKWAANYFDKINIFDFDQDLLIRLTNEIARYLMNEAERLQEMNEVIEANRLMENGFKVKILLLDLNDQYTTMEHIFTYFFTISNNRHYCLQYVHTNTNIDISFFLPTSHIDEFLPQLQTHLNVQFYVYCSNGTWTTHREQFRQAQFRIFEVFDEQNLVFQLGQVTLMYYKKLSDYHRELRNDDEADQQLCNAVRINRTIQFELRNQMVTKVGTNVSA